MDLALHLSLFQKLQVGIFLRVFHSNQNHLALAKTSWTNMNQAKVRYMGVVQNKSSQEPPFRKSFASFRGPIRVAFSKIKNSHQKSNIWNQTNSNTNYTINRLLFAGMNGGNQNVIVICCFFSLGPISSMAKCSPFWAGHGSSGYVFRASFARLSRTFRSKS